MDNFFTEETLKFFYINSEEVNFNFDKVNY